MEWEQRCLKRAEQAILLAEMDMCSAALAYSALLHQKESDPTALDEADDALKKSQFEWRLAHKEHRQLLRALREDFLEKKKKTQARAWEQAKSRARAWPA